MITKRLQKHLESSGVVPEAVVHRTVYTAYDVAQTTGLKLEAIAKTLLVKVEPSYGEDKSKYVIAVLAASHNLDLVKLKKVLGVKKVSLPKENVMVKALKVKVGALTPFGQLYKGVPVVIDKALTKPRRLLVPAGSYIESLLMKPKELVAASGGVVAIFAKKKKRG